MKRSIILSLVILGTTLVVVNAADVKENYEKQCSKCHGPDGKGQTKIGKMADIKDFTDAAYQAKIKEDEMIKAIKEGIKDGEKIRMKPAEGLNDDEVKALVAYIRGFKK